MKTLVIITNYYAKEVIDYSRLLFENDHLPPYDEVVIYMKNSRTYGLVFPDVITSESKKIMQEQFVLNNQRLTEREADIVFTTDDQLKIAGLIHFVEKIERNAQIKYSWWKFWVKKS